MIRPFDCLRDCTKKGKFRDGERAARGCTHPGLPAVEWDVSPDKLTIHMGAPSRLEDRHLPPPPGMGPDWWQRPPEPVEDGCPAGWILSPFVASLRPYVRRRTEGGGRVPNPRFDHLNDRVAQDAVLRFEDEQDRVVAEQARVRFERMKKRTEQIGSR